MTRQLDASLAIYESDSATILFVFPKNEADYAIIPPHFLQYEADSAANLPLLLSYEADRAAILLPILKYDADSAAILLLPLLPYELIVYLPPSGFEIPEISPNDAQ